MADQSAAKERDNDRLSNRSNHGREAMNGRKMNDSLAESRAKALATLLFPRGCRAVPHNMNAVAILRRA